MGRLNPALVRSLDILEYLAGSADPPTLKKMVTDLDLPKTSAFELVGTLVTRGYVIESEARPARYTLGPRTFQLGSAFSNHLDYVALGKAAANQLSKDTNETTHVAILDGTEVVYIARAESHHSVRMVSSLGARVLAHCTSVGKALLAELSEDEFDLRYPADRPLPRLTQNTIASAANLKNELMKVRRQGWAMEECESNSDVCCAAAVVRDHTGAPLASISVSVPESRWILKPHGYWTSLVVDAARAYSISLGYQTEPQRR